MPSKEELHLAHSLQLWRLNAQTARCQPRGGPLAALHCGNGIVGNTGRPELLVRREPGEAPLALADSLLRRITRV